MHSKNNLSAQTKVFFFLVRMCVFVRVNDIKLVIVALASLCANRANVLFSNKECDKSLELRALSFVSTQKSDEQVQN